MKLEDKFFTSFFYQFLIGVILSTLIVILFIGIFTNNYYDKRTYKNIINLKKNQSKSYINSAGAMLMAAIEKIHLSLNEQIKYYQRMANKILELNNTNEINFSKYLKCAQSLDFLFCYYYEEEDDDIFGEAIWALEREITENDLDSNPEVKKQLLAYDKIIPILNSSLEATKPDAYYYYFYFEKNELYIAYPISVTCDTGQYYDLNDAFYEYATIQCIDDNAEYYRIYKYKCEFFYKNFQKAKNNVFDNNYSSERNKTIFISNYYASPWNDIRKLEMCIQFDDPITKGIGYACSQTIYWDLFDSLESINAKINGLFFISNVGFNNVFYYPRQSTIDPLTSTLNIFNWESDYNLKEKKEYIKNISKIFTSNYIDYTKNSSFIEEIYVNGHNNSNQYFYMNNEKIKYSIFPILFENLYKEK